MPSRYRQLGREHSGQKCDTGDLSLGALYDILSQRNCTPLVHYLWQSRLYKVKYTWRKSVIK